MVEDVVGVAEDGAAVVGFAEESVSGGSVGGSVGIAKSHYLSIDPFNS